MFHGHSHDGGGHNHSHSHSHGSHSHSHGSGMNVGFGDDSDPAQGSHRPAMMNPMMMMPNPAAMLAQMPPEMADIAKRMMDQRQQLMAEFQAKGGQSNPAAVQELMAKASQIQQTMMGELRSKIQSGAIPPPPAHMMMPPGGGGAALPMGGPSAFPAGANIPINPIDMAEKQAQTPIKPLGDGLLGANANMSKLDELMNKKGTSPSAAAAAASKRAREEEEQKILDAIARKDYAQLNAVKATQYGVLERLRELVESGKCDPNQPDEENVYLLHWAAINNRIDIAKYLISVGAKVDPIGGELETTPLNWAARSGHVPMCVFLVQSGADPLQRDIEGFATLHLASMFGHSNVVAYLIVKGVDVDLPDRNGVTALMHACQRVQSRDPCQLLITFNARLNIQDSKGNTALHYCVAYNNITCLEILVERGASLDIKNQKGQTAFELAIAQKKLNTANLLRMLKDDDKQNVPRVFRSLSTNKNTRAFFTRLYPFLFLFYFGLVFEMTQAWYVKAFAIVLFWPVSYAFNVLFFDKNVQKIIPMAVTMSFITFLYATWFVYFRPLVFDFSLYSLSFLAVTTLSWYCLYKAYKTDPGVLLTNRDQMSKTILNFVEQSQFSLDNFCTSCIIRKPLRSKHCHECDRCVSKFDHHCPWVDNCIGENNTKYFVGFLFWTPICLLYYIHGAMTYYQNNCYADDLFLYKTMGSFRLTYQFLACSPWVGFFTVVAVINLFWISALFVCHLYQLVVLGLTTNERINFKRYRHFFDKEGKYRNPYNFGIVQNTIDLLELRFLCLKPTQINWKKEYDVEDFLNSRYLRKRERYEDV